MTISHSFNMGFLHFLEINFFIIFNNLSNIVDSSFITIPLDAKMFVLESNIYLIFISCHTLDFFKRFSINENFFKLHIKIWYKNKDYLEGLKTVKSMKVVNDVAIQLIQECINMLPKDENQQQYLLQVIIECKNKFSSATKEYVTKIEV